MKKGHLINPHQTFVKGLKRISLLELLFMSPKEIVVLYTYIAPCMWGSQKRQRGADSRDFDRRNQRNSHGTRRVAEQG